MGGGSPLTTPHGVDPNRHGSSEQDLRGENSGSYLNSMTPPAGTPRRVSPRTSPRARSPARTQEEEDDDYTSRQSARRESRRRDPSEPLGFPFRLTACETSIRDLTNEMAAQRLAISQLVEESKRQYTNKTETDQRLNDVFDHVDKKFTESVEMAQTRDQRFAEAVETARARLDNVAATVNNVSHGLAQRIEQLSMEVEVFKRAPVRQQEHFQREPVRQQEPSSSPRAPDPPQSWTAQQESRELPTRSWNPLREATVTQPVQRNQSTFAAHFGQDESNSAGQSGARVPSAPVFCNIGSPLSEHHRTTPAPATVPYQDPQTSFGQWAPGAGTENQPFDPRAWSADGRKVSKELRTYDGDMAHYDNWRRRIRDHFVGVNINYSIIFNLIEGEKVPIHWRLLASTRIEELPHMNWEWMSTHLWTFTANYLSDVQLNRRGTLVMGEEFNGLELWRALFRENCGGSAQLANLERSHFVDFPRCEKSSDLLVHLGQWTELKNKYGAGLPQDHLIAMFWKILPDDVVADIKRRRDLTGYLQGQIDFVHGELDTYTDDRLSKWNLSKLQSQLKTKPKNSTGIHAMPTEQSESAAHSPPPPMPDMAAFNANIERIVNAAVARTGRSTTRTPPGSRSGSAGSKSNRRTPNPSFKGCWCCGSELHSRAKCPKFQAIRDANGGKVPKDYVGEYEKSMMKSKNTPVKALGIATGRHEPGEYPETVKLWPALKSPVPTPVKNRYAAIGDTDYDDDDESEVVKALAALTPHVSTAGQSQRARKAQQKEHRPSNFAQLCAIARDVKSGKINLPDVDLDSDKEYTCLWALVDSGAGANVARPDHIPHAVPVSAPAITLSAANGEIMPNTGAHRVRTFHQDGTGVDRTFYQANVDMPILAVAELSQEGPRGSEVRFYKNHGTAIDNASGKRQHFVKRSGVYFVKIYVRKHESGGNESGFIRQGP